MDKQLNTNSRINSFISPWNTEDYNDSIIDPLIINADLGRNIGFDFARVGMKLTGELPINVAEGYKEGRYIYHNKIEETNSYERKLIRLRLSAYKRSRVVDCGVTPDFLEQINVKYCPITRIEMTTGTGTKTDATIDRLFNGGGYAVGNILVMSAMANKAKGNLMPQEIFDVAVSGEDLNGLSHLHWLRMACLTSATSPKGYPLKFMGFLVDPPYGIFITNANIIIQKYLSFAASQLINDRLAIPKLRQSLSGKKSRKLFDNFIDTLSARVYNHLSASDSSIYKDNELYWFKICDCWNTPDVNKTYAKFFDDLDKIEFLKLLDISMKQLKIISSKKENDVEAWSIETDGYTQHHNHERGG